MHTRTVPHAWRDGLARLSGLALAVFALCLAYFPAEVSPVWAAATDGLYFFAMKHTHEVTVPGYLKTGKFEKGQIIESGEPDKLLEPGAGTRTYDFCSRLAMEIKGKDEKA